MSFGLTLHPAFRIFPAVNPVHRHAVSSCLCAPPGRRVRFGRLLVVHCAVASLLPAQPPPARPPARPVSVFERATMGKMLLHLKQMVGRLIRSEDDRGLVVVVDPRRDRAYFERISAALPRGVEFTVAARTQLPALIAELGLGN